MSWVEFISLFLLLHLLYNHHASGHLIGAEYGSSPSGFIDAVKESGQWQSSSGAAIAVDSNGWPLSDGQLLLFDNRPVAAWLNSIDDPEQHAPNDSGLYRFSFQGEGTIGGYSFSLQSISHDSTTGLTTGSFLVPAGVNLVVMTFSNTKRNSSSPTNSGITNLRVVRPGYNLGDDIQKIFLSNTIQAHSPFNHIRYMGWRDTNYNTDNYGSSSTALMDWSSRRLPTDAHQSSDTLRRATQGVAWEYVILFANQINKDVWINIPVQASGNTPSDTTSYIYNLALLFKNGNSFTGNKGLNSNLNIYIEHSNEVWNSGFKQYSWNKQQAVNEVSTTNSSLNWYFRRDDWGSSNEDTWAQRRHLRRVYEIGQIFSSVFGAGSLGTRIRPIYAHFTIATFQYQNALLWFSQVYGPPSKYIWGIAQTKYYDEGNAARNATVDQVVDALTASSYDYTNRNYTAKINSIAKAWGVQHSSYEGGSGFAVQNTVNIGNRILANRSPRMRGLVAADVKNNWFALGGGLYNYFTTVGAYSRYGCWGLTDLSANLTTPKYLGIMDVIQASSATTAGTTTRSV